MAERNEEPPETPTGHQDDDRKTVAPEPSIEAIIKRIRARSEGSSAHAQKAAGSPPFARSIATRLRQVVKSNAECEAAKATSTHRYVSPRVKRSARARKPIWRGHIYPRRTFIPGPNLSSP